MHTTLKNFDVYKREATDKVSTIYLPLDTAIGELEKYAASPLQPWVWPTRPWTRLHIDFAGPKEGTMFLVIIDAHSKWMEVIPMKSATTLTTTQRLRMVFSRFGIPESIISDNGPQFSSSEFEQFCRKNGIRHIRVSPYHPASNGLAERAVQTFKQRFQKHTEGTIQDQIARLLFHYRITPHFTTGTSPSQLLFGRQIRSRLDTVKPSLEKRVRSRISKQKEDHDRTAKERILVEGQKVYAKNFRGKPRWLPGTIIQVSGPLSFRVELLDGRVMRCHQDQLRARESDATRAEDNSDLLPDRSTPSTTLEAETEIEEIDPSAFPQLPLQETVSGRRYPTRARAPQIT